MSQPITNEQRASIVYQYRVTGLTQDEFCTHLKATQRIHVAPRTLRAWCSRFRPSGKATEETVRVVADVLKTLQGLLGRLQAGDRETVTCEASHVAAGAALRAGHPQMPGGVANHVAAGPASAPEAPKGAVSPAQTASAGALPTGRPGGNSHGTIEFMPTEEAPGAEQPTGRRKGGVIWEV
jgi:hypothetical protein